MYEIIWSEWERIWARKKTRVSLMMYVVLLVAFTFWLYRGGTGFYTPELETTLNALNFSVFLLKEMGFLLTFIILPMLFVDSFNGEYTSGAFRLVLIRPQPRVRLLGAKWAAMAAVVSLFLLVTFLFGQMAGWLSLPAVSQVSFYPEGEAYSFWGALGYDLLFYLTFFFIYLAYLGIASLISTILPNAILSFFLILGTLVGTLYAPDQLLIFVVTGEETFKVLNGINTFPFLVLLFSILVITYSLVYGVWNRKSWVR